MACALEVESKNGYGGKIKLMVGITAEGSLHGIYVLDQKETPGLGAKIKTDKFQDGLRGRPIRDTTWKVTKDGGEIEAITAATISSRAVCEAIRAAIERFETDKPQLTATPDPLHLSSPQQNL